MCYKKTFCEARVNLEMSSNLAQEPSLADAPLPQYQSRDDLHITKQNLADDHSLADGLPSTRAEMTCIPLHKPW